MFHRGEHRQAQTMLPLAVAVVVMALGVLLEQVVLLARQAVLPITQLRLVLVAVAQIPPQAGMVLLAKFG